MNILKTRINPLLLFLACCSTVMAQPPIDFEGKAEEIEEEKVAFLSTRLDLTVDEGQVFWPVYNERNTAQKELRDEFKESESEIIGDTKLEELTDDELLELMDLHFELQQSELDLRLEYHDKLLEVLPVQKVAKFYKAEDDFKRKLMELLKEKGIDMPPPPPPKD